MENRPLTRTKIEWVKGPPPAYDQGFDWNYAEGCYNGCDYRWARGQAKRQKHRCNLCYTFPLHIHPERYMAPLLRKKPAGIFISAMGDAWGPLMPIGTRKNILDMTLKTPQHRFYALTKCPEGLKTASLGPGDDSRIIFPRNVFVGVSCENTEKLARALVLIDEVLAQHRFISAEPLLGPMDISHHLLTIDWVIVGALTRTGMGTVPEEKGGTRWEWVKTVVDECHAQGVPVWVKDNVIWKDPGPRPQEHPKESGTEFDLKEGSA